jgi:hypothetical protein
MADAASSEPPPELEAADAPDSLVADLRDLAEDTRTALEAELAFQQARASYAAGAARSIAIRLGVAALFAVVAICTLAIGLVISLAPLIGPWAATAVVVGALLAVAAIAGWMGLRGIRRVKRNAFPGEAG